MLGSGLPVTTWYTKVTESYQAAFPTCKATLEKGFRQALDLLTSDPTGSTQLQSRWKLCTTPNRVYPANLWRWLKDTYAWLSEFNYPRPACALTAKAVPRLH